MTRLEKKEVYRPSKMSDGRLKDINSAYWYVLMSPAIEVIENDGFGGYDWQEGALVKLKNHQYAVIIGSGCSCASFLDGGDQVELYQNAIQARLAYTEWRDGKH
jgi:hypothetical protein